MTLKDKSIFQTNVIFFNRKVGGEKENNCNKRFDDWGMWWHLSGGNRKNKEIFQENIPTKDIMIEHKSSNNRNANVFEKEKTYFRRRKK